MKQERVRGNSAAFPPQHAVEREVAQPRASHRPLPRGHWTVDGRQHSPVSAILASVERSQSTRFLQVARASKKEELQKSELYSLLFGKWLILLRAKSGGEKYKKSFSREGRTQFCFLQPLLYCILYRTFSFSCSSLNQSLNNLEDFTFFGERHVNHPISFGKSFG